MNECNRYLFIHEWMGPDKIKHTVRKFPRSIIDILEGTFLSNFYWYPGHSRVLLIPFGH